MQAALPWILFVIGVFYTLGGVVLIRQMAMDTLLDNALAAIALKHDRKEETATRILSAGAALTLASGLTLMAQSRAAVIVFALNMIVQTGYLAWSAKARPPEDEPERRGRQATRNALLIYTGVFGLVILMELNGQWRAWLGGGTGGLISELVAVAFVTAAFYWLISNPSGSGRSGKRPAGFLDTDENDDLPAYDPGRPPEHLRIAPEHECWPIWDDVTFFNLDPASLGLSDELVQRIQDWDTLFQKTYNRDDPTRSGFQDAEEERRWASLGTDILTDLRKEWTGSVVSNLSNVPALMSVAFDGMGAHATPPQDRILTMAEGCGVIEIRDLLQRLDELADDRIDAPEWDGDTQDDIARLQKFYGQVLARVDARYRTDVEAGLASSREETRNWVRLALDGALN